MLLKNKVAVITGGNRGIGKEILKIFSENGADIFACVRNIDKNFNDFILELQQKYGNKINPIQLELNDEQEVKNAANEIIKQSKTVDILVNNAGTIHTALFQMTPIKKLEEIFKINFFSQTVFTQYISKVMTKKKFGSIIFISSTASIDGNVGRSAYASSKASINSYAKVLSKELGTFNVRVNVIAPGLTETDMMSENTPKNIIEETISVTSLKRIATPKEIANVALFLSSDLSNHITGQIIRVDGGM